MTLILAEKINFSRLREIAILVHFEQAQWYMVAKNQEFSWRNWQIKPENNQPENKNLFVADKICWATKFWHAARKTTIIIILC